MSVFELYKNVISTGNYVVSDMEQRIETVYAAGKITAEQRTELLNLTAENAKDAVQIDVAAKLADLESRIAKLEAKGVVVWTQGHVTAKGETVLYDVDKDGKLDYCRYDGGRASTALSPGKINGWVVLDAEGGQIIATLEKGDEGKIIIVPIDAAGADV
jgi:hypothetical protein